MKTDFVKDYRYMFQANYKDSRITLTETVLLSWTLDKFLFPKIFSKIILFKLSRILEDMYSWNYNTNVRIIVPWYITGVFFWSVTKETPGRTSSSSKAAFRKCL